MVVDDVTRDRRFADFDGAVFSLSSPETGELQGYLCTSLRVVGHGRPRTNKFRETQDLLFLLMEFSLDPFLWDNDWGISPGEAIPWENEGHLFRVAHDQAYVVRRVSPSRERALNHIFDPWAELRWSYRGGWLSHLSDRGWVFAGRDVEREPKFEPYRESVLGLWDEQGRLQGYLYTLVEPQKVAGSRHEVLRFATVEFSYEPVVWVDAWDGIVRPGETIPWKDGSGVFESERSGGRYRVAELPTGHKQAMLFAYSPWWEDTWSPLGAPRRTRRRRD